MRTGFRILALLATVLFPAVAPADLTPACQRAVARGGAKFAKLVLKIGQRCAYARGADIASCRTRAGKTTATRRSTSRSRARRGASPRR